MRRATFAAIHRQSGKALLLVTLAGLLARAGFLLLEPETPLVADETTWVGWGVENLASDRVSFSPFRTRMIFHPPLFPYVIGLAHSFLGGLLAVKALQVVAGALLVPAVGLAGTWAGGPRAGLVAAGIAAFYPELVWYSVHLWSEPLFMVLLWWGLERVLAADALESRGRAGAAGMLWGLASLARETVLYFAPLAAVWMAVRRRGGAARAAVFLFATLLTVAPWTYRNQVVFGTFVPVSTMGGLNLWQGNGGLTRDELYARYKAVHGRIEQYRYARQKGIDAILSRQPWWLFQKVAGEMPAFWGVDSFALIHIRRGAYGDVAPAAALGASVLIVAPYIAVVALFIMGLVWGPLDRGRVLLLGFLLYYTLLHVVTYGYSRFRVPILPVLFVLAAQAWVTWRQGATPILTRRRKLLAWGLALSFALCIYPSLQRLSQPVPADEGGPAVPDTP